MVTSTVIFMLPTLVSSCHANDSWVNSSFGRTFDCAQEAAVPQFNDAASILFGVREQAVKLIFIDSTKFSTAALLAVGGTLYVLQLLAFGAAVPGGLFMPSILMGSCLGGAFGNVVESVFGDEYHAPYALMGAVAMLGGIQRSPVSLVVVIVEGTG